MTAYYELHSRVDSKHRWSRTRYENAKAAADQHEKNELAGYDVRIFDDAGRRVSAIRLAAGLMHAMLDDLQGALRK